VGEEGTDAKPSHFSSNINERRTRMKSTVSLAVAFMMASGVAFALDTTPGPVGKGDTATPHPSTSGRPSAILDDSQCQNVWQEAVNKGQNNASRTDQQSADQGASSQSESNQAMSSSGNSGADLSADQATPYIANFAMVDENATERFRSPNSRAAARRVGCKRPLAATRSICRPSQRA
jgi:hypothetical protein